MDTSLATILTGAGVAGVFCVLFVMGLVYPRSVVTDLKAEITELKDDRDAQRDRADVAVTAMQDTKNVMAALQFGLQAGLQGATHPRETPTAGQAP